MIRLEVLGKPIVRNQNCEAKLYAKAVALLAYLALEGRTSRRKIAEMLWAGAPDPLNNLSVTRGHIIGELGEGALVSDLETIALGANVWCDVIEWQKDPSQKSWGLYRGEFLQDLRLREWKRGLGEEFEEWVEEKRLQCAAGYLNRATQYANTALDQKDYQEAGRWLGYATSQIDDPREDATQLLILVYGVLGNTDLAVQCYNTLCSSLGNVLSAEPTATTKEAIGLAKNKASDKCERLLEARKTIAKGFFVEDTPQLRTYFALMLLEKPDLKLALRATKIEGLEAVKTINDLIQMGLIEPSGQVCPHETAQQHLEQNTGLAAELALELARFLDVNEALRLYRRSQAIWTTEDHPRIQECYVFGAREIMKQGFPNKAVELLSEAPVSSYIYFWKAKALERFGQFQEALELFNFILDIPENMGLKSVLYWRLGKNVEAKAAAQKAITSGVEPRAMGFNTLGLIAMSNGDFLQALQHFGRAAALWLMLGEHKLRLQTLKNLAIVRSELGEDT